MSRRESQVDGPGPFRADQLGSGDRYELRRGHAIYCAPTGGDGARGTVSGAEVLATRDEGVLDEWLRKAAVASSLSEVIEKT